jgi:hypothetical protein
LYLNSNKITDVGGIEIAKAIAVNVNLTSLGLRSNELNDGTGQILLDSLRRNEAIFNLDVDLNDFSYRVHCDLVKAIAEHKKFITANFDRIANRHIEQLKAEEQRLFYVREELKKQVYAKNDGTFELEKKKEMLTNLTEKRERDLLDNTMKLERLKYEYAQIVDKRRKKDLEFTEVRQRVQEEQSNVLSSLQAWQSKKQIAQSRMRRAESKINEAQEQVNVVLDDLKMHLRTIQDELKVKLRDCQLAQESLFEEEAAVKKKAAEMSLAAEMLRIEKKKKSDKKLATSGERKSLLEPVKKGPAPAAARAKTAVGKTKKLTGKVVTPGFDEVK